MMHVDEEDSATAYLSLEELSKIIERDLSGTSQTEINGSSDIVILADLEREKDWSEQV